MMVEILNLGVEAQKFLRSFPPPESKLLPFLTSCRTVRLLDHAVAARYGGHVLVIAVSQTWNLPDCGPVTPQLIGLNDLWDIVFTQKKGHKGVCHFSVPVSLKEDIKHETVFIYCSP